MRHLLRKSPTALLPCLLATAAFGADRRPLSFRIQEIARDFGIGYAVQIADMNHDGKPDVVAINQTQVVWFENPSWTKHVVVDGLTKKDNVCFSPHDIDGDGKLDIALGADWQPSNTETGGSLQWIGRDPAAPGQPWKLTPISAEPTLHRIGWGDVDGDGKPELVVAPLHGRGNKGPAWEGQGSRVLVFRPPRNPRTEPWPAEVADDSLHIVHNFIVKDLAILTASREGIHALRRGESGKWTKTKVGEGAPGEIKLGLAGPQRFLATVEPWHGNSIVIYQEPLPAADPQGGPPRRAPARFDIEWRRSVIEDQLTGGHALGWADFDGDGADDLAAGWRDKRFGVAVYRRDPGSRWSKELVDDGMAAEDLATGDLDGDGRPEIVAAGRATKNIRIYWNQTEPAWKRHVVGEGYQSLTAIAADFTGHGPDVIASGGGNITLYAAPDWKPVVLHQGVDAIHSAVLDVDGDGDLDYVAARYSPGLIFWLERPRRPLAEPWPYHVVDDSSRGGVDGIHGLLVGDVDKDGKPDLIGNSAQPKGAFPNSLAWFRIPRDPRNAPAWERYIFADRDAPGLSHYLGFGDVDGDGRPDLASAAKIEAGGNWFAWWKAPSDPKKKAWKKYVIAENQPGATNIAMADVNGDGKTDFIATRGHGRGVVWFEAPGWAPHEINSTITGPHALAIGDIDGDGDVDAVTCAKDDFVAAWFENDGKGNFKTHNIYHDQAAYDIRLVDMDGDGDLDVLIAGQESRNVVWYENRVARPSRSGSGARGRQR